jgi:hypothetical protein
MRAAVDLFLAGAVAAAQLDPHWLTVGAYDAAVAAAQLGLVVRGSFRAA